MDDLEKNGAQVALNPWHPITDRHQLRVLGKLAEELAEAGAMVARCIIQGVGESEPVTGKPNRTALEDELADVAACAGLAIRHFALDDNRMAARIDAKRAHLNAWADLLYAEDAEARLTPKGD